MMESEGILLNEIVKASNGALVTTEPLLSFARKATTRLRATLLAVQLDTQLMVLLLSTPNGTQETSPSPNTLEVSVNAADHMLSTLVSFLRDENIRTMPETLKTTASTLHGPFIAAINAATSEVETARRQFISSFKRRWLPKFISNVRSHSMESTGTFSKRLVRLLSTFNACPFAVGFSDDEFVKEYPQDRRDALSLADYQFLIREAGVKWVADRLQSTNGAVTPWTAHQDLIKLMWGGATEALLQVDTKAFHQATVDFSDMEQTSTHLSNSLRDSILRNASSISNMVFVGAEDSGKSTFLNAFIGMELLPTGGRPFTVFVDTHSFFALEGPTTSYPVRIRHLPGQVAPVMDIETDTLKSSLAAVRAQLWHPKIVSMKEGRWKGKGLPPGYDFITLKSRWQRYNKTVLDRFGALTADGFEFPTKVFGAENIRNTVRNSQVFFFLC
jgi:hypothetical protein